MLSVATVSGRLRLYAALAILASLGCAGVDYTINANKMACTIQYPPNTSADPCIHAGSNAGCDNTSFNPATSTCSLSGCLDPCDKASQPVRNCVFGAKNGSVDWTNEDCRNEAQIAGCTHYNLYLSGCQGYSCSDLQCAGHP